MSKMYILTTGSAIARSLNAIEMHRFCCGETDYKYYISL